MKLNNCKVCKKECRGVYCCKEHRVLDICRYSGESIAEAIKRRSEKRKRLAIKSKNVV